MVIFYNILIELMQNGSLEKRQDFDTFLMINLPEYYSSVKVAMSNYVDSNSTLILFYSGARGFKFDDGLFASLAEMNEIRVSSSFLCDMQCL